jgi:hypothetical protein
MELEYNIPKTVEELFENKEMSYSIIDYTIDEMDNIESMVYFLDSITGLTDEMIEEDNGTQVILKHPNYKYKLCIDSGGLGDFFSHGYDVSVLETSA